LFRIGDAETVHQKHIEGCSLGRLDKNKAASGKWYECQLIEQIDQHRRLARWRRDYVDRPRFCGFEYMADRRPIREGATGEKGAEKQCEKAFHCTIHF
jgi:hypothetical protein